MAEETPKKTGKPTKRAKKKNVKVQKLETMRERELEFTVLGETFHLYDQPPDVLLMRWMAYAEDPENFGEAQYAKLSTSLMENTVVEAHRSRLEKTLLQLGGGSYHEVVKTVMSAYMDFPTEAE